MCTHVHWSKTHITQNIANMNLVMQRRKIRLTQHFDYLWDVYLEGGNLKIGKSSLGVLFADLL